VPAGPAVSCALVLFLAPGVLWLALLRREDRAALAKDEAAFLALAIGVASSAWVGFVLAEAGLFSLVTAALVVGGACAVILVLGRRRASAPWRGLAAAPHAGATVAVAVLCFALYARPGEYLLGGRDPGIYVAAMGSIARTGGITYVDPAVLSIPAEDLELFYRHPERPDYSWGRFMGFPLERPQSGRVVPEFFHLFPAFGAFLFQAMGVRGALATPVVFGVLGTLAALLALRRIFGAAPALLGALLLAVNVLQAWFARYPVSEPMSQFLILSGLLAFAAWEERRAPALAVLAGALLGLSLLVRIDSVLLAVPLLAWLALRRAQNALRSREAYPLVMPIAFLAGHALLHAAFWSRKYLLEIANRPYWSQPPAAWLLGTALVIVVILAGHRLGPRIRALLAAHQAAARAAIAAALVLLALYAYAVRPALSAWAGADGNDPARAMADSPALHALDFHKLAAHDAQSLVRLGWFVTPLGLGLGLLGLVIALREWQPRYLFPILTFLTFGLFYFYKIRVYADYYFAMRRFVPVVLPLLLGLAAFAVTRLARRPGPRRVIAAGLAAVLAVSFLRDTLPTLRHREWAGAVRFVDDVARRFGPQDIVIFEQPRSIHLLSLPLWAVHGVSALELARFNPDPERLQHLVRAWRSRYRNIYFVHTYSTDLCGLFLQRVEEHSFGGFEWERAYGRPPRGPEFKSLRFTISRVVLPEELQVPALPEVDVGGSDDVQVSGFYDKEGGGEHTYRWTGSCASIYLPGARPGGTVALTVSAGRRPASKPAIVRVSLGRTPLGSFTVGPDWEEHRLAVPATLVEPLPVLRLDVEGWRPANTERGSNDVRDLGVMVDRVRVAPPDGALQ
jgi:hypothetical protein